MYYIPPFVWTFWLEACPPEERNFTPWAAPSPSGIHTYDVYNDVLATSSTTALLRTPFFHHIVDAAPNIAEQRLWTNVLGAFDALERDAETAARSLIQQVSSKGQPEWVAAQDPRVRPKVRLGAHAYRSLIKYFLFLRFRNSPSYCHVLQRVASGFLYGIGSKDPLAAWKCLLQSFLYFLSDDYHDRSDCFNAIAESIHPLFNRFREIEMCIGLATDPDEYILTATCFGVVEDDNTNVLEENLHYSFQLTPRITIYFLIDVNEFAIASPSHHILNTCIFSLSFDYDTESSIDVYQRNALLLQTSPPPAYIIFCSPRSMIRTLTYYSERRWMRLADTADYAKLMRGCRQESVTHTLMVRASIEVPDLTDDITRIGDSPVAFGGFADVWKALWTDWMDRGKKKLVALKVLRTNIGQGVAEKVLKRLKLEVLAWHRLSHPNIASLHGVMEMPYTVAMVSPWCENGTLVHYLKKHPTANRLKLLHQISSAIAYLHNCTPTIIHGDLKGGNVLIDDNGNAILTDFGLARVMWEVPEAAAISQHSFLNGSTRWMAPELILCLVEDEAKVESAVSTYSDVYAFACICLEVFTGQLPFPTKKNDQAVTIGVMRGDKPSCGVPIPAELDGTKALSLWNLMDKCWHQAPLLRPSMTRMTEVLDLLSVP